jgi:hypothetical protein
MLSCTVVTLCRASPPACELRRKKPDEAILSYAIKSILKQLKHGGEKGCATDCEAEQMVNYPLALPLMASPVGLVTLTVISANTKVTAEELVILAVMLLAVMAINLVALLTVDGISKYLSVGPVTSAQAPPGRIRPILPLSCSSTPCRLFHGKGTGRTFLDPAK